MLKTVVLVYYFTFFASSMKHYKLSIRIFVFFTTVRNHIVHETTCNSKKIEM